MVEVTLRGDRELFLFLGKIRERWERLDRAASLASREVIQQAAQNIASRNCPAPRGSTGTLARALDYKITKREGEIESKIFVNYSYVPAVRDYAYWQEYGYPHKIRPKRARALRLHILGMEVWAPETKGIPERPYLRAALAQKAERIANIFTEAL